MTSRTERLHAEAVDLLNRFDLVAADARCRAALSSVARRGDAYEQAAVASTLAQIRETRWRLRSADALYRRVLTLVGRRTTPPALVLRVEAIRGLGRIARVRGHYGDAGTLLRRAVRMATTLGADRIELGRSLADLGVFYRYQGRLGDAERLYRRALAIAVAALGRRDPDVAGLYHMLAGVEFLQGRLARAEADARRSIRIREAAVGTDHPDLAADIAALGAILANRGRLRDAERCIARATAIFRRTYGNEHYEIAVNLGNLGAIRYRQGRGAEAVRLLRQALRMKKKILGPRHPLVGLSIDNLAAAVRLNSAR